MISIIAIADAFRTFEGMSPKKMQKLCYYAYAWDRTLGINKIENTRFEAWVHGPVSPLLYRKHKQLGPYSISQIHNKIEDIVVDDEVCELVRQIYRLYGDLDGEQLEALTHEEDPWIISRCGIEPWDSSNEIIDEGDMIRYYSAMFDEHGQ